MCKKCAEKGQNLHKIGHWLNMFNRFPPKTVYLGFCALFEVDHMIW